MLEKGISRANRILELIKLARIQLIAIEKLNYTIIKSLEVH